MLKFSILKSIAESSISYTKHCRLAPNSASYSLYPSYYVEPKVNKTELEEYLKTPEGLAAKSYPVKAAANDETCSVFYDERVNHFINYLMRKGNKLLARRLVTDAFHFIKREQLKKYYYATTDEERDSIELDPKKIFHKAVENSRPIMTVTPVKRGGSWYQVPTIIKPEKATFLAMNWLILYGNEKSKNARFVPSLGMEILNAYHNKGKAINRKNELHKICENNKAYIHFRWA